jgi:hypothetical protein
MNGSVESKKGMSVDTHTHKIVFKSTVYLFLCFTVKLRWMI